MTLPPKRAGIFDPTAQPESDANPVEEQGGDPAEKPVSKTSRGRRRKKFVPESESDFGAKLYLSKEVRFRLRMYAFREGLGLSEAANELLDKVLPNWQIANVE
jgi:hypothetical protein